MSDEIINQAIEASTQIEPTQPVETTPPASEEKPAETAPEGKEPEEVIFPKKAINALSRRDKQIGKLQAQLAAERAELTKYRDTQTKNTATGPKEESFDNYGEFLKAKHRHEWEQEQSQSTRQEQERNQATQNEAWHEERTNYAVDKARHAIANIPDYQQLFTEHADILQSLPPHIERAFYEADEPALAFYALAKEGKLDTILNMSPARAAIEIGKAEVRGEALSKAKQITKAPTPLEGLKGAGGSTKSLDTMNNEQLLAWVNGK